ncbi:histidine phosphatase family protein [Amygdalobacter nucleatus]|uniref:Phosphoglycerate mutase family protein n=1 Tax=Amygdalobacter nucleatus TaxID=3029274 RepID=A0A133YH40_9FIRM|nr:histidine phosphatase family protein [Amygdalobacter nucleatus]KXB42503.1 phosphoglycerate mutase family protein [Amygdalobacter nucleatus]MDF0486077.1 histidine phosphatase family protein [Amygdalobacter nucleatus]
MVKHLYLVRHGQTQFNKLKIIQGSCDAKLTELGLKQAKQAGIYLKQQGIKFDKIYCSRALRARQTLETMIDQPYTYLTGLKEWDFGVFEGEGECLQDPKIFYRLPKDTYALFGGESYAEFEKRVLTTIAEIAKTEAENILIVAHGCVNLAFYQACQFKEGTNAEFLNCAIQVYRYENGNFIYERSIVPSREVGDC